MSEEDKTKKKVNWRAGRKFIAFVLCLISIVLMSIFGKGEAGFPYIVGLFTAYVAGNVVQKATKKEVQEDGAEQH